MIPGCLFWFHQSCLESRPGSRTASTDLHLAELRSTGLQILNPALDCHPHAKIPPTSSVTSPVDFPNLPEEIYRAAEDSITRGTSNSGIVGDARRILHAREIIASAGDEANNHDRVVEWQEKYGDETADLRDQRKEVWVCMQCQGII